MGLKPNAVKFVLMAQDMERAVRFYQTLGFEVAFTSPHWSELRFGDSILGLHGGSDGKRQGTGLSVQYDDVKLAYVAALNAGATSLSEPVQRDGEPIMLASVADPEGNGIMLTQYVGLE